MKFQTLVVLAEVLSLTLGAAFGSYAADSDYVENLDFSKKVTIAFSGASATVVNNAGSGVTYSQDGAGLVFTSTVDGVEYILSGAASSGYVRVQGVAAQKVTLNGVNLTCTNGPAIAVLSTNRCFLVLANGTVNTLTDGSTYTLTGDGALHAAGPMIISDRGSLTVTGKKKHGIYSAAYIRLRGGDVTILGAPKDGIHLLQYFQMDHGSLTIAATGDGIDADVGYVTIHGGQITIASTVDDTRGIKCDGLFTVNGGVINVTVKGIQSKAFKSAADMTLNGGTMIFNLSGGVYLGTVTNTSYNYVDPSYCTAIKCDSNLTINAGTITITHNGTAGKGISVDGNIVIRGGTLDILTTGGCSASFTNDQNVLDVAAADCMKADGNLTILGGTITAISSGNAGDAISSEGYMIISNAPSITASTRGQKVYLYGSGESAEYSNPKAIKAVGNLTVYGGTIKASTKNDGGEGMESKNRLTINGGTIEITAYDDCINAATNIAITGGNIYCYSMGNDGIDCNGTMQISGGTIITSGTTAPEEGFDCDANTFTITGGTMVGTGGASSTPTSSSCTQRSVLYNNSVMTSGTIIQVKSASTNLLVYKVPRSYSSSGGPGGPGGGSSGGVLLFSMPALANATYYIVSGATVTGGTEFHGLYTGATVTGGTTSKTFTASSMVTSIN